METSKVNKEAPLEIFRIKWRHSDPFSLELRQCATERLDILTLDKDRDVSVERDLDRSVQDAGLPSHQQRLHAMLLDRRKDFACRGEDQVKLRVRDIADISVRFRTNAARASDHTSLSIHRRKSSRNRLVAHATDRHPRAWPIHHG